jgi:site-specific DNA-methyltransferase (adenine-specific)
MIQLINDDALIALTKLEESTIDLTVTSPPYDNLRTYNGNNAQWGEPVWKSIIEELYTVTKKGGVVVWVVGDATIKGSETGTSFKQALWAMECGFNLHDTMIWNKGNFTAVGALKSRYAPVFEYMFIFTKGKVETFNPIKDRKNKHFGDKYHQTVRQADGSTKDGHGKGKKHIAEYGQRHNDWLMFPEQSNSKRCHPAQFPEQLAHDHILSWSNEGDTVLDCFMGSGTTGKMAKQLGRKFIGIELDETYFNIAKERIGANVDNSHCNKEG